MSTTRVEPNPQIRHSGTGTFVLTYGEEGTTAEIISGRDGKWSVVMGGSASPIDFPDLESALHHGAEVLGFIRAKELEAAAAERELLTAIEEAQPNLQSRAEGSFTEKTKA